MLRTSRRAAALLLPCSVIALGAALRRQEAPARRHHRCRPHGAGAALADSPAVAGRAGGRRARRPADGRGRGAGRGLLRQRRRPAKAARWPTSTSSTTRPRLTDEARAILEKHALWLQNHRSAKVAIEGHCDERGTVDYNLALGEQRARAARDYLVSLGVAGDRLTTVSYGKERPLDPASNEAAWAKNRRAHFLVSRQSALSHAP